VFRIGDSDTGFQTLTVKNYDSVTQTITTVEFIDFDYSAGSDVTWRNVSYIADTSVAAWDNLEEVTVVWEPQGIDAIPWSESWEVVKRASAIGALEQQFKVGYPRYYEDITDGQFEAFSQRAQQRLKNYFESKGRSFTKIIDSEMLKEPWLITIAILVALANSDRYENELKWLQLDLTDQLAQLDALPLWDDTNQDLIKAPDEEQPSIQPGLSRGL
jgi:hypothetical protein